MLLIHTALPFEAHPIIRSLGLKQTGSPGGGRLYADNNDKYALLVSGVGGNKTRKTLQALLDRLKTRNLAINKALNIGLAADPGKRFPIETALSISSVRHFGHQEPIFDLSTLNNDLQSSPLRTIDTPCTDPTKFANDESIPLLDMEGWYFVDTLINDYDLSPDSIHSIKIVSDYGDGTSFNARGLASGYDEIIKTQLMHIMKTE